MIQSYRRFTFKIIIRWFVKKLMEWSDKRIYEEQRSLQTDVKSLQIYKEDMTI